MAFGDPAASTPAFVKANAGGRSVTTASFTPASGDLLVAFAWHDTAGGNLTNTSQVTSSDGVDTTTGGVVTGGATPGWTRRATRSKQDDGTGAANGHIAISTAVATGVSMTVTTTGTNTGNPTGLYCLVIPAGTYDPAIIDITPGESTTTNAVASVTVTTVTDGARVWLIVIDWNLGAAMTAGAGMTALISDTIGGPDDRIWLGVSTAVVSPAGSFTAATGSPSTGNTNNAIALALRPAAGGGPTDHAAAAALSAVTTLTAAGTITQLAAAPLTSSTTLTAGATLTRPATAALTASPTLGATAVRTQLATAALTASPVLDASAGAIVAATATLSATTTITAAATADRAAQGSLQSSVELLAAAIRSAAASAALTASPSLSAAALIGHAAAAALAASPVLQATAEGGETIPYVTATLSPGAAVAIVWRPAAQEGPTWTPAVAAPATLTPGTM